MKTVKYLLSAYIIFLHFAALAESSYPESAARRRKEDFGSLLGGSGKDGIEIYDSNPNAKTLFGSNKSGGSSMNVNQYLWQAALNTLSFMPLASADSNGGVIITDWYEDPNYPGERYKVNAIINSTDLRVESLKLTVFKQASRNGSWHDVKVNARVAIDLEEKILTNARELKIARG